jgi:hypothetical protein
LGGGGGGEVEVSVISRAEPKARLITLTETLIIPHITKTEFNNCFIIHLFVLLSKYKNLPTFASVTCFVFILFVLFSVAITALLAHIALGSGRISLSFLYIRQFVAMDTPFVRFFA